MMLYIAIKVAMERKDKSDDLLPSNRSELYEAFISTLFSHQEKKGKISMQTEYRLRMLLLIYILNFSAGMKFHANILKL